MLGTQLILGTLVVVATVVFHVSALIYLSSLLKQVAKVTGKFREKNGMLILLGFAVLFILAIHTVEAWLWAAVYYVAGEFDNLSDALYFSAVTSTTLGYGDLTLSETWRLLSSFEAMGGLILFGASTAFLLELMRRLFERED